MYCEQVFNIVRKMGFQLSTDNFCQPTLLDRYCTFYIENFDSAFYIHDGGNESAPESSETLRQKTTDHKTVQIQIMIKIQNRPLNRANKTEQTLTDSNRQVLRATIATVTG